MRLMTGQGLIYAEALSFHMARHIPRPKPRPPSRSCASKCAPQGAILQIVAQRWPEQDFKQLFTPAEQLGRRPGRGVGLPQRPGRPGPFPGQGP